MTEIKKQSLKERFHQIVSDDNKRRRIQYYVVFSIFLTIALAMTILNIFTHKGIITLVTGIFAGACLLNIGLLLVKKYWAETIAVILFTLEVIAMFAYFIISGGAEGFSVLWIILLPAFGLLLFRIKWGSIFSGFIFLVIIFFFWLPMGQAFLQYEYSPTFMMRFPILYVAFFLISLFLESLRGATYNEMKAAREKYEFLSNYDALTGLYNRFGYRTYMAPKIEGEVGVVMCDMDHFKDINDKFGHINGDIVIKEAVKIILNVLNARGDVCRWGGEELLIVIYKGEEAEEICEEILSAIRSHPFKLEKGKCRLTISIGLVLVPENAQFDEQKAVSQADKNLYKAKEQGRDRMIVSTYKS